MPNKPILIVMLTQDDKTIYNARLIFEQCKTSKAQYFGFKESPLPLDEMKELFSDMKKCGKHIVLEVVSYSEEEGLEGAKMAQYCGCDILMGTMYSVKINDFCKQNNIRYMPFVGEVTDRPSVLSGDINNIIAEAKQCIAKGAYGIDLLGYRYTGDASLLNSRLVKELEAPVCIAGSVNSVDRLDEIKSISPWAFTIGSAFFENSFGKDIKEQIDFVYDYINS